MANKKINIIKRFLLIYLTHYLFNLKENIRNLLFLFLYIKIVTISLLLGLWNLFGVAWHIFIILIYLVVLFFLIIKFIKEIKYYNKSKILLWIESNNFRFINPLTALKDKPAAKNYNKYIWALHKVNVKENLENINFKLPIIYLSKHDPLNIRYLFLLIMFLAIFWAHKNNKLVENTTGWIDMSKYINKDETFEVKAWVQPPKYTKLREKLITIPKSNENISIQEPVPIQSEFKVFIKSINKDFAVKENNKLLNLKKNDRYNHELTLVIEKDRNKYNKFINKDFIEFDLAVVQDKAPMIKILSFPNIVNQVSLSFVSRVIDDYGIKNIILNIKRPPLYKHFQEEKITYSLFLNQGGTQNDKLIENYFYKFLADMVWAGSNTTLEIIAKDYSNQQSVYSENLRLPKRNFKNELAIKIFKLRKKLARRQIKLAIFKNELTKIFKNNQYLLSNTKINNSYNEIMNFLDNNKFLKFTLTNELFRQLYFLAEMIEEGDFYITKKNLEQVEQNLFDSIKQKDSEKISTNVKELKEKMESLLDIGKEKNKNNNFKSMNSENIRDKIEELTKQIEDLLKAGSQEGVKEKMQKLQQLSESIKNPNSNKEAEEKFQQKKEFINKLSELLNEQEKVMEETFNRAAERGKFEQSSEGSGGKSPKEKQEELRNTLGNVIREIGASENEIPQDLGRADRAMRQASRDLDNGRPDEAANAQGRALEMIQRSINKINLEEFLSNKPQIADKGKERNKSTEKEYLSNNENIEYQGTSSGGVVDILGNSKIKSASKIANKLYKRYNQEDRSLKEKRHLKNLLDWY